MQRLANGVLVGRVDVLVKFFEGAFGRIDEPRGLVPQPDQFASAAVFVGVLFGFGDQCLHLLFRQATLGGDANTLGLAGAEVLGGNARHTVGVDAKRHFNLGDTARSRGNAQQFETTERHVVCGHFSLALNDVDADDVLIVFGGGKDLALGGRDGGVLFDDLGRNATLGFDAERKRSDIQQQHVFYFTVENGALNGCTHGDHFVGIYGLVRCPTIDLFDLCLHPGHPGHAANQDHVVDVFFAEPRVFEGGYARLLEGVDEFGNQFFETRAIEGKHEVLGTFVRRADERQVDVGFFGRREFVFGALGSFFEALKCHCVLGEVDSVLCLEFLREVRHDAIVEVFAAEEGIAVGALHFEDAVANFEHRNIEGAAAQIEHHDSLVFGILQTVGECCRGGFVDDALNVQPRNGPGLLGGLALGIVEVGRYRDDGVGHGFADVFRRGVLHL